MPQPVDVFGDGRAVLHQGDCRDVMAAMPADSVDSVVCDPPYGLNFMCKNWDRAVPGPDYWAAALRVAKPGAALVAFGGTRTAHRMTCAIEDAGWEIRDTLCWLYGQGFPKSLDISKAIDKAAGAEREVVGRYELPDVADGRRKKPWNLTESARTRLHAQVALRTAERNMDITAPATVAAAWRGWGTALKPGWEPIILAMKPLDGTFAANALEHGVAGLNIDGCRIEGDYRTPGDDGHAGHARRMDFRLGAGKSHALGRFPANVILDGAAAAMLDEQSGYLKGIGLIGNRGGGKGMTGQPVTYGVFRPKSRLDGLIDNVGGGASRFFYCAKAATSEREAGLDDLPQVAGAEISGGGGTKHPKANAYQFRKSSRRNLHPTVKPLDLMRWLCRLTSTPAGGLVLDPFAGSGSTGVAAVLEGRPFVGIEIDPAFVGIAARRIRAAVPPLFAQAPEGRP